MEEGAPGMVRKKAGAGGVSCWKDPERRPRQDPWAVWVRARGRDPGEGGWAAHSLPLRFPVSLSAHASSKLTQIFSKFCPCVLDSFLSSVLGLKLMGVPA